MKKYIILVMLVFSTEVFANCQNAVSELTNAKTFALKLDQLSVGSVRDNAKLMRSWHNSFYPYEGRTVQFPFRYFSPIAESAQITYENAESLRSDFQKLHQKLNQAMSDLELCLK